MKQRADEKLVMRVVAATALMLPRAMEGGFIRLTRVAGEGRARLRSYEVKS